MQVTDILARMGGLQSMARELGISESEAARGAEALAPAILGGFKRQAQSQPQGLDGLGGLLGQLGGLLGGRSGSAAGASPGLAAMLDMNGDGNVLDDILNIAGKAMK